MTPKTVPHVQRGLPVDVTVAEVARERSLGGAIALCYKAAGLEPKQVQAALGLDKAQCSRWEAGSEGVVWPRLAALMDISGNDAPLMWMLLVRGYDLSSLRRTESETEARLRASQEEVAALRRVLLGAAPRVAA